MKDVSSGKMLFFVPQIGWSGGNDDVDPAFLTDVANNNGRNNIVVQKMCAPSDFLLQLTLFMCNFSRVLGAGLLPNLIDVLMHYSLVSLRFSCNRGTFLHLDQSTDLHPRICAISRNEGICGCRIVG